MGRSGARRTRAGCYEHAAATATGRSSPCCALARVGVQAESSHGAGHAGAWLQFRCGYSTAGAFCLRFLDVGQLPLPARSAETRFPDAALGQKPDVSLRPSFRLGELYSSERGAYAPVGDQRSAIRGYRAPLKDGSNDSELLVASRSANGQIRRGE
jgi:hypothetical protein